MSNLHKVFLGFPFRPTMHRRYEKLKEDVETNTPLSIQLPDTAKGTSKTPLLQHLTAHIQDSAGCIFDITGENANVALELGIAHATGIEFMMTRSTTRLREGASTSSQAPSEPVIADLKGLLRIDYSTYEELRDRLYEKFFPSLPLYDRWMEFKESHGAYVPWALGVYQKIRERGTVDSPTITAMLQGSGLFTKNLVKNLKGLKLISYRKGKQGGYCYPSR